MNNRNDTAAERAFRDGIGIGSAFALIFFVAICAAYQLGKSAGANAMYLDAVSVARANGVADFRERLDGFREDPDQ